MPYGDLDIPRELYGVYGMIKWFAMGEDYPPQSESTIRSAEAKMAAFSADYARASSGVEHLAARIPQVLEGETADLAYAETSTVMQGVADDLALMSIAAQLTLGLALTTEHTKITLIQGMAFIAVEFAEAVTYPGIGFAIAMEWIAFGGLLFYATRVAGRSKLMNTAVKLAELRGTPVPGAAGRPSNLQDLLRAAQQTGSIPKVFSAATVREALEKHGLINIAAKMLKEGAEEGVQEISENIFAQAVQYAQEKRKGTKDFDTESAITDFVAGLLIGLLISKYNLIGNKMFGKDFMHRGRVQGLLEGAAEVPVEAGMIGVLGGSFGGLGATFVNAFLTGALPMELHHALERMLGIQVARHNDSNTGGHDYDDAPPPYSPAPPAYEEAANPGLQAPPVAAAGGARSVPTGSTNGNGAHAGAASNPPVSTTGPTSTLTTAGATSSSRGVDGGSASPAAGNPASSASTQGNAAINSDGTAATVGQPTTSTNQTVDQTAATPNGTPATTTTPASGATHQAPADAAAGAAAQPTTSAPDAVAATSTADTPGQAPPATPVGTVTTSPDGVQQSASSHTSSASTSHDPGLSNAASPTSPTNQPPAASSSSAPTTAQAGLPLHYDGNAAAAAVNQPSPPPADTSSNATTATTTTTTPPSHQGQEITQSGTTPAAPQSGTTDPTADSAATPQNPAPQASASASQTTNPTTAQNTAAPTSASSQPAPSSRSTVAGPTAADTPLPLSHAESSAHGTSVRAPATAESATQPSASTAEATHARAEPSTEGAFGTRRPIEKPSDIEDLGRLAVQAAGKRAPGVVGPQWCLAVVDEFWQLSVPSRSAQGRAADTDARDRGAVWRGAVPPASWPPVTSFAAVRQGLGGAVPGRRAVVSMGRPSLGSGFGQIGHVFAVMSLPDGTLHAFDPGDGRGEPPRSFPADQLEQRARAILGTQVDLRWQVVETDGTPVAGLPSTVGSSSQISAMLDLGDTRRGAGRPHSPNSPDRRDDVPPAVSLPGPRSEALQGGSPGEPSEPKAAGRFVPKLASQSQALRPAPERAPEPRPDSTPEPNPPDTVKNPIDLNKPLPAVPGTAEPAPDLEQPSEATPAPDPQPQPDPTTEPDESTASDDSTELTDALEQSITSDYHTGPTTEPDDSTELTNALEQSITSDYHTGPTTEPDDSTELTNALEQSITSDYHTGPTTEPDDSTELTNALEQSITSDYHTDREPSPVHAPSLGPAQVLDRGGRRVVALVSPDELQRIFEHGNLPVGKNKFPMILVHGVAADGRLRVTEGTGERLVTPEELHELTAPHLPPGETVWLLSCAGGLPNGIAQRFAEARESDVVAAVDDVTAGATAPGRDGAVLVTKGGQSWLLFVPSNRTLGRDVWDVVNEVDGGRPFDGVTAEEPTGATGGVRLAEGTEGEATNVELIMNQQTINDLMLETDSRSKVLAENKYLKIVVEEHGGKWIPEVVTKPVKMFAGDVGHLATRDVEQALDEIFDWFESIDQETTLDQLRHYGFAVKHLASMVRVRRPDPGSPIILGVQFSVGTPPYVVPDFLTYAQSTNYNHDAEDLLDQARSFAAPYGASAGLNGREAESLQGFITHLYTHFGAVVKSSKNDAWKSNLVVVERTNFDGYREGLPKDVRDYVVEHGKEIMDSITRSFEQEFRNPGGALLRNSHLTAADYLRSAVVPDAQPVNQYQALGIRFYFPELDYNRDSDGAPRFPEGLVVQELRTYGRNVRLGSTRAALQQNRRELRQDVMRRVDPLDPSFGQIRATFDMDDDAMRSGQDGQVRVLARLIASHVKINPKTKPLKALRDYNIMLEGGGSRAWRGAKHARDKGDNRARAVWSELSAELAELLTEEELAAVVPIFTSRGDGPSIAPEGIRPDVSSPSDRRKVAVWGVPEAASAIPSTPTAGNNATQSSSTARWSAEDSTSGTTARPPFPVTPHHLADHSHPNRVLLLPPGDTDNQTAAKNYHLEPDEYGAFVHADKHGPHLNSHRITEQQLAEIIATHPDSAGKKLVLIACGPTTTYLNNTLKALPHHPSIAAPNTTYYTPINPTPDQPSGWAATLTYDHNGTPHFTPGHFNIVTRQPGTNTLTHTTHTTPIPDPLPANHTTTWAVQRLPIIGRPQTVEITREPRGDTADGFFTISERHISVSGKGLPVGTQLEDLTHVRWTATPHPNGQPGEYAVTFHSLEDGDDHLPLWSQVYASSPFTAEQVKESLPQPRSAIQGRPGSEALREAVPSPPFAAEARTLDEAIGRERSIKIASTAVTVSKAPPAVVFAMGLYPPGGGSGADAVTGWQTDSLRGRPEAGSHLYIGVFRGGRTSSIGFDVETTGLVPSDVLAGAWPISSIDGNNVVLEEWQANSQFASAARSAFDRDLSFDHVRRWFAELNLTVHVSAPSNRLNAPESDRPIVSRLASDEVFHGYDELIQSQATGLSLAGDTKAAASQLVNFLADQGQFSTPDVEIDQLGSRAGSFSRDEWEIWIDAATRVEELSTVVLHETGHVEQWFSVARMVAGWGSPDVLRMWFPRTPQRVLDAAWANPMISDDPQYGLAVAIASENFPSSAGADLRVLRNLLDQRLDRAIDNIERALSDGASHLSPDVADQLKILGAIARLAIAADFAYRENAAEAASFGLEELQARWNRGGQEKPQQGAPNGTQFLPDTITTAMSRDDVTVQLALLGPGGRLRVPADMLGFDPIFSDSALAHFKLVRGQQPRFEEWIDFVSPMDMARQGIFAATSKPRVFEFYASWVVEVLPTETWWVRPADFQGSPPSFGSATPLIMVGAAGVATSTVVALAVRSLVRDWGADALNDPAILQIHANPGTNAFQVTKELYEAAGVSIRSSEADGWAVTALGQDSRDLYYYAGNADAGFVLGDLASRLITVADGLGSADERVSSALTDVSALAAHVGAASVKGLFDAAYAAARQYGLDGITTDRLMETRQTIDSAVSDGRHGSLLWSTIAEASTPGSVAGGQSTPATEAHSEDVLTLRPHNNAPSSPTVRPPFPATPHHLADHSHPNRVLLLHPSDTDNQTAAKNYHLEPDEYGAFVHADQHGPHLNNHHITEQQLAETITRHPDSAGKKIILIACGPTTTYLNNTLKALPHHPSIAAPNTTYHTPINPTPDQPPGFVGTLTYDHNGTPHLEPAHFNILTRQPGTNTLTHTTQPTPIPNPLPPPHTTTNWTKPDRQQRSQTSPPAPPATSRTGETSRVRPSIDDDAASGSDAIMAVADESDSDVERHSSRGPRGAMNQQDGQSGSRRILPSSQGKRRAESGSDPGEGPNKRARGELPAENGWTPEFRTQYRIVAGRFERLRNPFAPRVTGTIRERYPRPYDRTPEERAEQSQRHLALAFFDVLHRQGQQLPTDGGDDELAGADDRMSDGELSDPGSSDSELSDPGSSDSELSDLESSDIELPDAGERVSVDDDRMSRDEPSEDDSSTYESGDEPSEDDSSAYESGGESENSTDDAYGESEPESSASERAAKPQRRRKSRRAGKATKAEDHEYEIQTTWLWRRILIASNQNSTVDEAVRLLGEQPGETPAEQFRSFLALGHPDAGRGLGEDGNAATNYRDGLEDAHVKLREGYDGDRHNDTTDVLRNLKGWTVVEAEPRTEAEQEHLRNVLIGDEFADHIVFVRHSPADGVMHAELKNMIALRSLDPSEAGRVRTYGKFRPCMVCSGVLRHAADAGYDVRYNPNHGGLRHTAMQNVATHLPWTMHHPGGRPGNYMLDYLRQKANELVSSSAYRRQPPRPGHYEGTPHGPEKVVHPHEAPAKPDNTPSNSEVSETEQGFVSRPRKMVDRQIKVFDSLGRRRLGDNLAPADKAALRDASSRDRTDPAGAAGDVFNRLVERHLDEGIDIDEIAHVADRHAPYLRLRLRGVTDAEINAVRDAARASKQGSFYQDLSRRVRALIDRGADIKDLGWVTGRDTQGLRRSLATLAARESVPEHRIARIRALGMSDAEIDELLRAAAAAREDHAQPVADRFTRRLRDFRRRGVGIGDLARLTERPVNQLEERLEKLAKREAERQRRAEDSYFTPAEVAELKSLAAATRGTRKRSPQRNFTVRLRQHLAAAQNDHERGERMRELTRITGVHLIDINNRVDLLNKREQEAGPALWKQLLEGWPSGFTERWRSWREGQNLIQLPHPDHGVRRGGGNRDSTGSSLGPRADDAIRKLLAGKVSVTRIAKELHTHYRDMGAYADRQGLRPNSAANTEGFDAVRLRALADAALDNPRRRAEFLAHLDELRAEPNPHPISRLIAVLHWSEPTFRSYLARRGDVQMSGDAARRGLLYDELHAALPSDFARQWRQWRPGRPNIAVPRDGFGRRADRLILEMLSYNYPVTYLSDDLHVYDRGFSAYARNLTAMSDDSSEEDSASSELSVTMSGMHLDGESSDAGSDEDSEFEPAGAGGGSGSRAYDPQDFEDPQRIARARHAQAAGEGSSGAARAARPAATLNARQSRALRTELAAGSFDGFAALVISHRSRGVGDEEIAAAAGSGMNAETLAEMLPRTDRDSEPGGPEGGTV